jgi:hypothetical protein
MEISQGNSLCSYLYLKQAKMSLFSFFLYKTREWGPRKEGVGTSRMGEVAEKGGKRVNMVQKCVHKYESEKMIPVESIPGMGSVGEGVNPSVIYLIHCKNFSKCHKTIIKK